MCTKGAVKTPELLTEYIVNYCGRRGAPVPRRPFKKSQNVGGSLQYGVDQFANFHQLIKPVPDDQYVYLGPLPICGRAITSYNAAYDKKIQKYPAKSCRPFMTYTPPTIPMEKVPMYREAYQGYSPEIAKLCRGKNCKPPHFTRKAEPYYGPKARKLKDYYYMNNVCMDEVKHTKSKKAKENKKRLLESKVLDCIVSSYKAAKSKEKEKPIKRTEAICEPVKCTVKAYKPPMEVPGSYLFKEPDWAKYGMNRSSSHSQLCRPRNVQADIRLSSSATERLSSKEQSSSEGYSSLASEKEASVPMPDTIYRSDYTGEATAPAKPFRPFFETTSLGLNFYRNFTTTYMAAYNKQFKRREKEKEELPPVITKKKLTGLHGGPKHSCLEDDVSTKNFRKSITFY